MDHKARTLWTSCNWRIHCGRLSCVALASFCDASDAVDRFLRSCWQTLRLRTYWFSISIVWSDGNQPRLPSRILSPSNQPKKTKMNTFICNLCRQTYRQKSHKKLIRRWDSERELSLRRHCTRTKNTIDSCINSAIQIVFSATHVYQIQWNNAM